MWIYSVLFYSILRQYFILENTHIAVKFIFTAISGCFPEWNSEISLENVLIYSQTYCNHFNIFQFKLLNNNSYPGRIYIYRHFTHALLTQPRPEACLLLHLKSIFFHITCIYIYSNCVLGFELCQNVGGQHSVLFLNASSRFVLGDPEEIQYSISLSTLPKWTNKVCFG